MIVLTLADYGTEGFVMILGNCFNSRMWESLDPN